ncbi:MAG: asparagine synthase (glutamine-hydrolyzing) [Chthoniobacterales bacterium]
MCGICGVFEYQQRHSVTRDQLVRMNDTIRHRGPDDEGYYVSDHVGLAMRRLSIIDVAGGHQPISNEDDTISIVFNGEIYNYAALRGDLLAKGHLFRTNSDTEVIVHLYEEDGVECVQHLDGMFAFAIHDRRQPREGNRSGRGDRLFLARDRLGKKPLYYADTGGAFIFGSELKPILQDQRVSRDLDFEALAHYLSLLVVPAPYSMFKDAKKLPAGCYLECDASGCRITQYWSYLSHVGDAVVPEEEAIGEIRNLLFEAVQKRLISEVPLGAFLSGGIDSSAVVAIMSRLKSEPVKTFSIGFDGPLTHNELPHARLLARHYGTDHHEFVVKPDIVEIVNDLVNFADEPFGISSAIPTYLIAKAAREHVTVVLTGDGGDEIFGGYPNYLYERWAMIYRRLPNAVDKLLLHSSRFLGGSITGGRGRWASRVNRFAATARASSGERRLGWASGFSEAEKRGMLLSGNGRQAFTSTPTFLEESVKALGSPHPELEQNCMDVVVWLTDEMLTKVDRMTMAASVEARCPLLDQHLVEYAAQLSFGMKIPGRSSKHLKRLLRSAVADLLPANLLQRRKHGFNVPLDAWFRNGARSHLESVLSAARLKRRGLFDPAEVSKLLHRHGAAEINASNRLYALLVFETWAEKYLS